MIEIGIIATYYNKAILLKVTINTKAKAINYLKENYKTIYSGALKMFDSDHLKDLNVIVKKIIDNNFDMSDLSLNFKSVIEIKENLLIKSNFSKKSKKLSMVLPFEVAKCIEEILNDNKFKKDNSMFNSIALNFQSILDVYGILTVGDLFDVYEENFDKFKGYEGLKF